MSGVLKVLKVPRNENDHFQEYQTLNIQSLGSLEVTLWRLITLWNVHRCGSRQIMTEPLWDDGFRRSNVRCRVLESRGVRPPRWTSADIVTAQHHVVRAHGNVHSSGRRSTYLCFDEILSLDIIEIHVLLHFKSRWLGTVRSDHRADKR